MGRYLKVPKEEKVDCFGCASPCCKSGGIVMTPNDDPKKYRLTPVAQASPFDGSFPTWVIPNKPDGSCHYLGETGCTIHADRPAMCRSFSCVVYARKLQEMLSPQEIAASFRNGRYDVRVWKEGVARDDKKFAKVA